MNMYAAIDTDPIGNGPESALTAEEDLAPERRESSLDRAKTRAEVTGEWWARNTSDTIGSLIAGLKRVDRQLLWVDRLLYLTQPPASGRVRIVWEKDGEERYVPRWVSWIKVAGGAGRVRWRYRILSRPGKAVCGKGGFGAHREEVRELVRIGAELMSQRRVLIGYVADLSRAWTQKQRALSERESEWVGAVLAVVDRVNAKGLIRIDESILS